MVENQTGYRLVFFQSDRGGEFMLKEFDDFLEEKGITCETSAPETPQQNGLAERMVQTLKSGSRALLTHSGMSKGFWVEAMRTATHVLNCSPRKGLGWCTPYKLFYGHVPNISYFQTFGCCAWVYDEKATKWDPKMKPLILVGYETGSKAYRLWDPSKRSIMISAKVRFDETVLPNKPETDKPVASSSNKEFPLLLQTKISSPSLLPSMMKTRSWIQRRRNHYLLLLLIHLHLPSPDHHHLLFLPRTPLPL